MGFLDWYLALAQIRAMRKMVVDANMAKVIEAANRHLETATKAAQGK